MGVSGLLLVAFGSGVNDALRWVWPPALLALAIWMTLQAHRQLHSRTRRWLLYPVIAVMAVASVGGGYETVREHLDARAYQVTGQLIDVGGYRLHIHCTGSGSPTVVLQPGGGDMSSAMGWIARRLPITPESASMTGQAAGGATLQATPRTASRSRPTCTRCCIAHTCQVPMCWQVTPSVACMYASLRPAIPMKLPEWC